MNTTENNKLIAEFMGNTIIEQNGEFYCKLAYYQLRKIPAFDTDWNRLMEVVEKIESLGYGFNFFFRKDKCYVAISNFESKVFIRANGIDYNTQPNKIEAVYNACVTFIEWYNKNRAKEN